MKTLLNLTFHQEKQICQKLFPAFQEYNTPFNYGRNPYNWAVVETWGLGDHLVLLLKPGEHYRRTESRYTSETAARKLNIVEATKHFLPEYSDLEVPSTIQSLFSSNTKEPLKDHKKAALDQVNSPIQYFPIPIFKPNTKPEEVPDDLLRAFGEYKNYDPLWALNYLIKRQRGRKANNKLPDSGSGLGRRVR